MRKLLVTIGIVALGMATTPAVAHPGGGGGGGAVGHMGGGASGGFPGGGATGGAFPGGGATGGTNGRAASDRDFGRDRAEDRRASHTGGKTLANSNGRNAMDRDFGRERAADRRAAAAGSAGADTSATVTTSSHRHFGGRSASHISAKGRANTNGPNAMDRDFGRDRASDR
jgi:hypothetical protein